MRLFVAILLPEPVKDALCRGISALKEQGGGNFTRRENLHLTLAFLGETTKYREAVKALQTVQAAPFQLTLQKTGNFGPLIWAGAEAVPALMALQEQTAQALRSAGFRLDEKNFRPHLTLCRQFAPYDRLDRRRVEQAIGVPSFRVEKISLMNSERLNGKLTYTEVYSRKLT